MGWIVRDYWCDCGNRYNELLDTKESQGTTCPECDKLNEPVLSCPSIATFSLMDKKAQADHLKERSAKHTKKLVKQNQ